MIEKIIFNLLAFTLFIITFFKMIRKNDTIYLSLIIIQAIGIAINFLELILVMNFGIVLKILMYVFSIIIPVIVIILEKNKFNYSELIYIAIAKICMFFKDSKQAKKFLVKLVTKYPESYMGHKYLGEIYEKEGAQRKAIDEYVKAVDINSKDYNSYYKIAYLLDDLEKHDEARQMLENLLNKKPEYYEASILLGNILYEQEKFKEASNIYLSAIKYAPYNYDLYYNLAMAYSRLNDFQSAKEAYEKAALINELEYNPKYNLAQIALIYSDLEEAEKYFNKSLYSKELEGISYYYLSKIALIKKDKENAISLMNMALEVEPTLIEKLKKDDIFITILNYINLPKEIPSKDKKIITRKAKREEACRKHLEQTYELVGKLNTRDINVQESKIQNLKIENKQEKEISKD